MPKKPDYISDEEWAEWCRKRGLDPNDESDIVVPFDQRRKKKKYEPPKMPEAIGEERPWYGDLRKDDRGRVIPDLRNVLIGVRAEPSLARAFSFDEMLQEAMLKSELPLPPGQLPGVPPDRKLSDDDVTRLQEWLQHCGLPRIGREIVGHAMHERSGEFRSHPVRKWLESLEWDGEERLSTWLKTYLGAHSSPDDYLVSAGRMFLISMVARVFRPGCKCDYMLVLEGEQGILKSRACQILGGEWFSDSLPENISSKDAKDHLRGKWLIEMSELAAFSGRAALESLKAFITRTEEQYRPPYQKHEIALPRQCVFIGTTNHSIYVPDETGARRVWPVKVGQIDIRALQRDRAQLFAEALDRYRHGEQWWPDPDLETRLFKPQQEATIEEDVWLEPIAKFLDGEAVAIVRDRTPTRMRHDKITVGTIAKDGLGFDQDARVGTADQRRITKVLRTLGWRLGTRGAGGVRYYYRMHKLSEKSTESEQQSIDTTESHVTPPDDDVDLPF